MGNSPPPLDPMSSLISLFRQQYPQGSLCCDLLEIDRGLYVVQASVTIDGVVWATALAAQSPLETAEDMAKERVLSTLNLSDLSAPSVTAAAKQVVEHIAVVPESPPKKEPKPVKQSSPKITTPKITPESKPEPPAVVIAPQTFTTEPSEPVISPPEPAIVSPPSFPPSPDPVPSMVESSLPLENVNFYDEEEPGYIHGIDKEIPNDDPAEKINELPLPLVIDNPSVSPPQEMAIADPEPPANVSEEPMDFSEIIARSNLELKRLGWTSEQGRNYLLQTYGKRSRQLLSDDQLIEFLAYLEQQPNPE